MRSVPFRLAAWCTSVAFLILASTVQGRADDVADRFADHDPASTLTVEDADYAAFLDTYRVMGEDGIAYVRYGDVSPADRRALQGYIARLEGTNPRRLNRDEQFAFWANLYNAVTIELILDKYPLDSITDIGTGFIAFGPLKGPWNRDLVTVLGEDLSLDDIEHEILRVLWDDPRVHYAVNCASIGCPNLAAAPFRGATLDATLDANARAYVNHPRGARFDDGGLIVSSIYKWFQEDFGGTEEGVIDHLKTYARADLAERLAGVTEIEDFEYDWSLNEPAASAGADR